MSRQFGVISESQIFFFFLLLLSVKIDIVGSL